MQIENPTDAAAPAQDEGVPRPQSLAEFNGQSAAKENLIVAISSAVKRGAPLDHVLFDGPPGVGKTTLAAIMAHELGSSFKAVIAPALKKPSDIFSMLSALEDRDVLFIDEIHRLTPDMEEILHPAMEDFRMDLVVGEPGSSRIVAVPLPRFTLIGATTRRGMLTQPFRDRFKIQVRLQLYTIEELELVVERAAGKLSLRLSSDAVSEIALRARGTPRIALNILSRVLDHAVHFDLPGVDAIAAGRVMDSLGIDSQGLNQDDRHYVEVLGKRFNGGPVGLGTLAMALGDTATNIENTIEPYLIMRGLIDRTPRGRVLVSSRKKPAQGFLFGT